MENSRFIVIEGGDKERFRTTLHVLSCGTVITTDLDRDEACSEWTNLEFALLDVMNWHGLKTLEMEAS